MQLGMRLLIVNLVFKDTKWAETNAGFAPGTANTFRNMLGLSEAKWEEKEEEHELTQQSVHPANDFKHSTLFDFLGQADDF